MVVLALGLVLILGASALCGRVVQSDRQADAGSPWHGLPRTGWDHRVDQGATFTDGMTVLRLAGDAPVTVTDVRPVLHGDGITLLGARVAGFARTFGIWMFMEGFPPQDETIGPMTEAIGAELQPGPDAARRGYVLLAGYRIDASAGRVSKSALDVSFEYRGRAMRQTFLNTFAICGPAKGPECPSETGED